MITGFNTDVQHRGRVFHVQTEEKGPSNPVMVTLVYCRGQIVGELAAPYAARDEGSGTPAEIRRRMLEQHRVLVRAVQDGKYDLEPLAEAIDRAREPGLDELVLDYLERSIDDAREAARSRAAHTARVLERLGRMLTAAERARIAALDPEPHVRFTIPAPPRRSRRARLALAALIAAAALSAVTLPLVGPALAPPARVEVASALPAVPSVDPATVPALFALDPAPVEAPPIAVETRLATPPATAAPRARAPHPRTSLVPPKREVQPTEPPSPSPAVVEEAMPVTVSAMEPAVESGDLVELAAVDVRPLVRRRDLPRYTARARRAGLEGTVELALLIDERGEVADVMLLRDGAGAELVDESLATVRDWTFSPARKDRQPVKVWQEVAIDFTILPNRSTSVRIRE